MTEDRDTRRKYVHRVATTVGSRTAEEQNGRDLGDGCGLECVVVDVRLDALDDGVGDVVFVKLEQTVEELLRIGQQQLARLPVVVLLLAWLSTTSRENQSGRSSSSSSDHGVDAARCCALAAVSDMCAPDVHFISCFTSRLAL